MSPTQAQRSSKVPGSRWGAICSKWRAPARTRDLPPQAELPTTQSIRQSQNKQQSIKCPSIPAIPAKAGTEAGTHVSRQNIRNVRLLPHLITLSLSFLLTPLSYSQDWGSLATISSTMGVNEGRLCLGESSRGDLGCPAYAPYVSSTSGNVGIGLTNPTYKLEVAGDISVTHANINGTIHATAGILRMYTGNANNWLITKRSESYGSNQSNNLVFSYYNGSVWTQAMDIASNAFIGMGITSPTVRLDVSGSIRLANEGSASCDSSRTGAIKYQSGDFHLCRNGTSWESLASITANDGTPDRLISGTTQAIAYQNTSLSLVTAGTERMVIGTTGNIGIGRQPQAGHMLAVSGATVLGSPNGAELFLAAPAGTFRYTSYLTSSSKRWDVGANQAPETGTNNGSDFFINRFADGGTYLDTALMIQRATGNLGIGTANPATKLEVAGTTSTTTLQLADNPPDTCTPATYGRIKIVNGRQYTCRP